MKFGSTRYYHYFTQYAEEINGSYISDPISTYAATAIAGGRDVGSSVIESLKTGNGMKLKQYYQYARIRFGNRYWKWDLQTRTGNTAGAKLDKKLGKLFITNKKPYTYIAEVTPEFHVMGPYLNQKIKDTFGIDEFNDTYQGKQYIPMPINETYKGFSVLKTLDKPEEYLYLQEKPEESLGVIYWDYSEPVLINTEKENRFTFYDDEPPAPYPKEKGKLVLLKEWAEEYNPFGQESSDKTVETDKSEEDLNKEQENDSKINIRYTRKVYKRYVELDKVLHTKIDKDTSVTRYRYKFTVETYEITYNKEEFAYLTKSGLTNSPSLKFFLDNQKENKVITSGKITSETDPSVFKLYPYLPLKDFGRDAWGETWLVPKLSRSSEIVKLQAILDEAGKAKSESLEEKRIHEPNQSNPRLPSKDKKSKRREDSKLLTYNGKKYTARALQRRLNRYLSQKRKIKFNKLYNPSKQLTESATKRHIDHLATLLGVDYESLAANMLADSNYENGTTNIRQRAIMPSVKFSSNIAEVQAYWFYFFKRLYRLYGEERDFGEWKVAVSTAKNFNDLPMKQFSWTNQSGLDWGGMAWMFIRKFEIDGSLRKIKRYRRLKEIKRGKPITIKTLEELQDIIEPPQEIADDKYHTSKNGTQHCIGGQKFSTSGTMNGLSITELLKDFNYTFFCKQGSNGKLEVYAVAGLAFNIKMIHVYAWGTAWHDLGMQYARNHNRYIGNKKDHQVTYDAQRRMSKRHYFTTKISHFGVMPVDYNIIRRIGATELERLAIRIPILYGFTHAEAKGKAKWVKPVIRIVQVIITIVGAVLSVFSGGTSNVAAQSANLALQAFITAVVTAVLTSIIISHLIIPLLRLLGLKGIIAMIVAIIIVIVASMLGGQPSSSQSALPYGSEVGKQTATQVASEVARNTGNFFEASINAIKESFSNMLKQFQQLVKSSADLTAESVAQSVSQGIKDALTQFPNISGLQAIQMVSDAGLKAIGQINAESMASIKAQSEKETELYENAQRQLDELKETVRNVSYDVKAVMEAQRLRFRMYDPSAFLSSNVVPDTYSSSFEYLSNLFNIKLNVDPATTDVAMTPDFSFNNPYKTI